MKLNWPEFFAKYRFRIWGVVLALLAGVLILTINFWRTLLLSVLIFTGYMIGRAFDGKGDVKERVRGILDRILPKG